MEDKKEILVYLEETQALDSMNKEILAVEARLQRQKWRLEKLEKLKDAFRRRQSADSDAAGSSSGGGGVSELGADWVLTFFPVQRPKHREPSSPTSLRSPLWRRGLSQTSSEESGSFAIVESSVTTSEQCLKAGSLLIGSNSKLPM